MTEFKWAYGQRANVKEPIPALKENGWQYADVPTASNFNWVFREIGNDLYAKSAALKQVKDLIDQLKSQMTELQRRNQQTEATLTAVKTVSDQTAIDSAHYRRAIHACLHSLNSGAGERLGLDAGVDDDYPFEHKRNRRET